MARLLDSIESHRDLRKLDRTQLPQVAQEIRDQINYVVSKVGVAALTRYPWSDPEDLPEARTVVVWGMDPVATSIHNAVTSRQSKPQPPNSVGTRSAPNKGSAGSSRNGSRYAARPLSSGA